MSTIMVCGKCGGAMTGSGSSYTGRRCACSDGGVATMTDSAATGMGQKLCRKCGQDVTHDRRMKDHLGHYWCYECGAADQAKKGQGVSMVCPGCNKHFRPTHMMKYGEGYLCEICHAERQRHPSFGKGGLGKLAAALLVVAAGAALVGMYAMGIFP